MLTIHSTHPPKATVWKPDTETPAGTPIWQDLLEPKDPERTYVESLLGARLPTQHT